MKQTIRVKVEHPSGRVGFEISGLADLDIRVSPERAIDLMQKLGDATGQAEITSGGLKQILRQEIDWCERHPSPNGEDHKKGFIGGLTQAIFLIESAEKAISSTIAR